MNRRPKSMLAGSPVLVGAVTVIVTMVAVFLSYNANEGLPFVPTYKLTANVPNANGLVRGNEVRMGGARIGVVTEIETDPQPNGDVAANLSLELDERIIPLPKDSTIVIRPRSALGLKYVEVTKGESAQGYAEEETIPLEATSGTQTKEIDDFFNMFDEPTRTGSRVNLETYGAGFAGRGESIGRAFSQILPAVEKLEPVMRNWNAPRTAWAKFFPALEQAAAETAPVAQTQADLWVALNTTFTAWASVSESLKETISEGPPALETATRELPQQRPFLASSEELFRRFRPAFASLASAAPGVGTAFAVGAPALRRTPGLNRRLARSLELLERFGDDERVPSGLARIANTMRTLKPTLAFLTPAQTTCNYGTLFFRNIASLASESDTVGAMLNIGPMALPLTPGSEGGPSAVPANGPPAPPVGPGVSVSRRDLLTDSYLHSNPYPNTAAPGQTPECEAGNEGYKPGVNGENQLSIGNPANSGGLLTEQTVRVLPKRAGR